MSWRDRAKPIIARVLWEHRGADEATIRAALREAYPFGQRAHHPYKTWLDEIHRQRGTGRYAGRGAVRTVDLEARIREIEAHNARVECEGSTEVSDAR